MLCILQREGNPTMHCNKLVKKIFYIVDESKEMLYFFLSKRHLFFYAMHC